MTTKTRYATAAAVGGLYTALAVWFVGAQARSYRDGLRRDREQGHAAPPALALHHANTPAPLPVQTQATLAPAAPTAEETAPATREPIISPSIPKPEPMPVPEPEPAPALERPEVPEANNVARSSALPPRPVQSPGAVWADSIDLNRLTPEEEARLGAELQRLVLASNLVDPNGDLQRLKRVSDPLIAKTTRKEVQYSFAILDSDEVNAFSLPGGYIYVSRGLFQLVGEAVDPEQDYALQFALGHEIAHVDLKHALTLVAAGQAAGKAQGVDTLNQLMVPIGMGYPDAQEFAADTWAYQRMTTQLGHTRREALMFLIKLQGFSERNGFRNGRLIPDPKSGLTLVENHYRAHPAAWDRLDRLKARGVRPAGDASPSR